MSAPTPLPLYGPRRARPRSLERRAGQLCAELRAQPRLVSSVLAAHYPQLVRRAAEGIADALVASAGSELAAGEGVTVSTSGTVHFSYCGRDPITGQTSERCLLLPDHWLAARYAPELARLALELAAKDLELPRLAWPRSALAAPEQIQQAIERRFAPDGYYLKEKLCRADEPAVALAQDGTCHAELAWQNAATSVRVTRCYRQTAAELAALLA